MAKEVKEKLLGARFGPSKEAQINLYLEKTDMNQSELFRSAVDEFMINHPVKDHPKDEPTKMKKPGED